jgi:hypothetical protein
MLASGCRNVLLPISDEVEEAIFDGVKRPPAIEVALGGASDHSSLHQRIEKGPCMRTPERPDFSVVVKNRGRPSAPWRWEIYRSGRNSPVKRSEGFFSTMSEADRAGKKALGLFISEYQN